MTQEKRDDEKSTWLIAGAIFTLFLIGIDLFYSSFNKMELIARAGLWILHIGISCGWIIVMAKFKDPGYDYVRKVIIVLTVLTSLTIGIHHSTIVEDKQVIIDSKENAAKP